MKTTRLASVSNAFSAFLSNLVQHCIFDSVSFKFCGLFRLFIKSPKHAPLDKPFCVKSESPQQHLLASLEPTCWNYQLTVDKGASVSLEPSGQRDMRDPMRDPVIIAFIRGARKQTVWGTSCFRQLVPL